MNEQVLRHFINTVKHGHQDSDQHLLTVWAMSLQVRAKRVLELGVRTGNTTLPFLLAMAEMGGHVDSVDLSPTTFQCPDVLKPFWTFYQSDAIAWLEQKAATGAQYDVVYIDDWHSYPHVKKELEFVEKMITPSSIILLHDLMYSGAHPDYRSDPDTTDAQWEGGGPYRAVAELDPEIWEWATVPVNHGLTLLRKKSGRILRS